MLSKKEAASNKDIGKKWATLDVNKDGKLDQSEYARFEVEGSMSTPAGSASGTSSSSSSSSGVDSSTSGTTTGATPSGTEKSKDGKPKF